LGFFEQQDRARRATVRLAVLYALAVALIVALVNLLLVPAWAWWEGTRATPIMFLAVSAATILVISLGSVEIAARLSLGEQELATLLAGKRVPRGSGIDAERRLINVVDEMAIASGLAAPPVYVLTRERGINAFAAGRSPNQAIVVVTRGALEELSRDELQAVIAHEFSHILNGDIRINLRAACVLQGIVFLSAIGRFMMLYYSGYGTEEQRRFFHPPLAAVGAGLYGLGWVGLLAARLIQAAIFREREFLADACAVQYTRNADALCGALARVEVHGEGSRVLNWHADSMAHMLFAPPARSWLAGLFATHPASDARMKAANPHTPPDFYFDGRYQQKLQREKILAERKAKQAQPAQTIVPKKTTAVAALIASIGQPDAGTLEYAQGLLHVLPASVTDALADAVGAQALMLALVIDAEATARGRQLRALEAMELATLARKSENLAPLVASLDRAYRLPLVALALPVLRKDLDQAGRAKFLAAMRAALQADGRINLGEFVLDTILDWNLGPKAKRAGRVAFSTHGLQAEIALVLSLLAHAGTADGAEARRHYEKAKAAQPLVARDALQLGAVSEALERLGQLAPHDKEALLAACGEVAAADGDVKLMEHELLRAVACALDCPMPPAIAALDPRLLRR
jgi:Zn-dependent protease with chaperone function/uncharacterized tellurite resistance protein B-like protein